MVFAYFAQMFHVNAIHLPEMIRILYFLQYIFSLLLTKLKATMKKVTKSLAIVLLLAIVSISAQAQVKFGPRVGLNLSSMTLKSSGISIDPTSIAGINAGVQAEIALGSFAIQPAFLMSMKGSKYGISTVDASIKPIYVEIPVNIVYKIGAGPLNVLLLAGPYVGYGIGGKAKYSDGTDSYNEAINFGSGDGDDMKPLDGGINLGGGVEISHFQVQAQYSIGLANLSPSTEGDAELKNRVFSVSLIYLFGGK
jgi:hypothetical protein